MRYKVSGVVEMNFECEVEADSEDEAEDLAIEMVEDGDVEYTDPVDKAEINLIEPAE